MKTKKILITGVSSGIGHALTEALLGEGHHVYGLSRRAPHDFLERSCFHFKSVDLSQLDRIRPALCELLADEPALDLVILNAAALGRVGDVGENTVAELNEALTVNVTANKLLLDSLFVLSPRIAQVVAISSCAAIQAARGSGVYSLSKAALNMLIAAYAEERKRTHFSAIAPWIVDTDFQDALARGATDDRYPLLAYLRQMKELGEIWTPEQAARELIFISEKAFAWPSGSFAYASESAPGQTVQWNIAGIASLPVELHSQDSRHEPGVRSAALSHQPVSAAKD